jgi:hypothetical protein
MTDVFRFLKYSLSSLKIQVCLLQQMICVISFFSQDMDSKYICSSMQWISNKHVSITWIFLILCIFCLNQVTEILSSLMSLILFSNYTILVSFTKGLGITEWATDSLARFSMQVLLETHGLELNWKNRCWSGAGTRAQEQAKKVLTLGDEDELWGGPSSGHRDAGEGGGGLKRLEARWRNPLLPLRLRRSGTSSNGRGGRGRAATAAAAPTSASTSAAGRVHAVEVRSIDGVLGMVEGEGVRLTGIGRGGLPLANLGIREGIRLG